jgi:cell division protein FtsL
MSSAEGPLMDASAAGASDGAEDTPVSSRPQLTRSWTRGQLRVAAGTAVVTSLTEIVRGEVDAYEPVRTLSPEANDRRRRAALVRWHDRLYVPLQLAAAIYLGLSFVERPMWCYYDTTCASPSGEPVPMSGVPMLPPLTTGCVELACYVALLAELVLMRCYRGEVEFWGNPWRYPRVFVVLVGAADCAFDVVALGMPDDATSAAAALRAWRLTPILRPLVYTVSQKALRKRVLLTFQVLWDIKEVLSLVAFFVMWFSVVMFAFFRQFCVPPECDETAYYGTVPRALLSSFTILTTANFPDVYLEAYDYNRLFALPFIAFVVLGIFLALNLILASVYSSHKQRMETSAEHEAAIQEDSLDRAFQLLLAEAESERSEHSAQPPGKDDEPKPTAGAAAAAAAGSSSAASSAMRQLPVAAFRDFVLELDWHGKHVSEEVIEHAIEKIDADNSGHISKDEFRELCRLLPAAMEAAQNADKEAEVNRFSRHGSEPDSISSEKLPLTAANDTESSPRSPRTDHSKELIKKRSSQRRLRQAMREREMQFERCMVAVVRYRVFFGAILY